jgi:UDP-GlcNAc:undecaprenyl-phosphate GlcNAc-1-phosphate transferase
MGVRAVAAVHWGFAAFHALLVVAFLVIPSPWKALAGLPALAVQLLWLAHVMRRMKRAGIGWR